MNIGYVGIGIMGSPMALNLLRAGHALFIHNRTAHKCQDLAGQGATVCANAAEVAAQAHTVFINVPDTPDVEAVLFAPGGIYESAQPDLIVVDNSTISPVQTRVFAERLAQQGVGFLDAPVSGGDIGAQKGSLSIMVGGDRALFDRCLPLFEVLGAKVTHVGAVGMGQTCKACNQLFCALHMLACCEGISLAKKAGLDPSIMVDVVSSGAGGSWALQNLGPRIVDRDVAPGFMIDLLCKDLKYSSELGSESQQPLLGLSLAQQLFKAAQNQGWGREGTQALSRVIEALS